MDRCPTLQYEDRVTSPKAPGEALASWKVDQIQKKEGLNSQLSISQGSVPTQPHELSDQAATGGNGRAGSCLNARNMSLK